MDDTHITPDRDDDREAADGARLQPDEATPAKTLAALDPADAPDLAEQLAADLADDLEAAGAPQSEPTQLAVDIDGASDPTVR